MCKINRSECPDCPYSKENICDWPYLVMDISKTCDYKSICEIMEDK